MQYGNNGNRMGRGMATSQGRGPSPMGMQNAAPQGQMGLQQAQAQALRGRQFGGGAGGPIPSFGIPTQPPGTIAPQAPTPMQPRPDGSPGGPMPTINQFQPVGGGGLQPQPDSSPGGPAPTMNQFQPIGSGGIEGTIAPQAPMPTFQPPPQPMGTIAPQAPMPMGGQNRPEMMMPQRNSFAGGAGMGQRPYGGNRGYGRR